MRYEKQCNFMLNNLFGRQENKSLTVQYAKNRVHKENRNFLVIIEGDTGSGKTWAGLRFCEQVDPFFNKERITFNVKQFSKLMTYDFPTGSAFLLEEAGVTAHNLNFHSNLNKTLNYIVQTFRHRNYILVVTLPRAGLMDGQTRDLFHAILKSSGRIDREKKKSYFKLSFPKLYKNVRGEKKYFPMPLKVVTKEGLFRCNGVWFNKPSQGIIKAHALMRDNYTKKLNKVLADTLENAQIVTKQKDKIPLNMI